VEEIVRKLNRCAILTFAWKNQTKMTVSFMVVVLWNKIRNRDVIWCWRLGTWLTLNLMR